MRNIAVVVASHDMSWSTAKVAVGLNEYLNRAGYSSTLYCARSCGRRDDAFYISGQFARQLHIALCRITGMDGSYSTLPTRRMLRHMKAAQVDTVFIAMTHGCFINEGMLYEYIRKEGIALVNIMLTEYPYLGKCHFGRGCTNYLDGCRNCPQENIYPKSLLKAGHRLYERKERSYKGLRRAVFVGPEITVENARKSPLMKDIPLALADESIDVSLYRPRDTRRLRAELGIPDDKIVCMCVAVYDGVFHERKGVPYYIELARKFEHDDRYAFVQVAYVAEYPGGLPSNYIPVGFIDDNDKVAEYLSLGDIFVFPSVADTMPNTCLEALACGTPLLAWRLYGNERMAPEPLGTFVTPTDVDAMAEVVRGLKKKTAETVRECREYAVGRYDSREYFKKLAEYAESL